MNILVINKQFNFFIKWIAFICMVYVFVYALVFPYVCWRTWTRIAEFGYLSLKLCFCFVKQMDELQVIVGFVQAAKRLKTVCKWEEMIFW